MMLLKVLRRNISYCRVVDIEKLNKIGDKLCVQGWIKNIRRLKKNVFLDLSDGSTNNILQIVLPNNECSKAFTTNSTVRTIGCLQKAPNGNYELVAQDVKILAKGNLNDGYPFTPKQNHAPEYNREYLHLRSRIDLVAATMRFRHRAQKLIHDYMDENGFVQISPPILTTNDCEGAGEVFKVQPDSTEILKQMSRPNVDQAECYFDSKVFLTVSGQLHLEAMSHGLGNTYSFTPVFRAENSKSPLHLSEFYMLEAELAFIEELEPLIKFIETMLKTITQKLFDVCESDLNYCQRLSGGNEFNLKLLSSEWPILTYDEAVKIIIANKQKFKTFVKPNEGFSKEQEMFLVNYCKAPVFVVDWPTQQKPFYVKKSSNNDRVHAMDLLAPTVGELCGGSLRENDIERLKSNPNLPKEFDWYLELRKFGGIPTGGFGMGFERYLQLLTGIKNIRDVIPFPRYPHSCNL